MLFLALSQNNMPSTEKSVGGEAKDSLTACENRAGFGGAGRRA